MKSFATRIAVASTLALSLLVSSLGPVQAQAFDSYDSGVQVQNLENRQGAVTLKSYTEAGTETTVVANDSIAPNGSNTYYGATLPLAEGFKGAMVVSANVQVAAIANINTPGFTAAASYLAASDGATRVQLPLLMKDNSGYTTWFAVQNTSASVATVNIAYSSGHSVNNVQIQPGAARTFYQADEPHGQAIFSAIITSDQPVVAAVIEENPSQMFAYTGFTSGSTNPVMPLVNANNAGYQTGIQILNGGNASTDVTVTYTPAPGLGTQCTETQTIPAGQSRTFALHVFAPGESPNAPWDQASNCVDGERFVGAAEVTGNSANQELTAIVNQNSAVDGEAYGAFDPAAATSTVVFPLILDRRGADFQFWTGFNVMNVGNANTTVNCTFTDTGFTQSAQLAPGGVMNALQQNNIAEDYAGSATCTASQPIVGVVNEVSQTDPNADRLLVYEGANISAPAN